MADIEADRAAPLDFAASERRKAFIAAWRKDQALRDAARPGDETPLAEMDSRGLHGEASRRSWLAAIDAKIERLESGVDRHADAAERCGAGGGRAGDVVGSWARRSMAVAEARIATHAGLRKALIAGRRALGLSQEAANDMAGAGRRLHQQA